MVIAEKKYYYNQPEFEEKQIEQKKQKKKIKQKSYRLEKVMIFSTIFIILCASLLLLLRYSIIIESRYAIHTLSSQLEQLETQTQKTKIAVEKVTKSKNIESQAISRLNMVYPNLEQTMYINIDPIEVAEISNLLDEKFHHLQNDHTTINTKSISYFISKLQM